MTASVDGDPPERVLLVDDDRALHGMLERRLERVGLALEHVDSVAAAIAACVASPPDLLILDHSLPDGTAATIVDRLRELGEVPPFLVATGCGDERLAVEMMRLGALDYVIKDASFLERMPHAVMRALAEVTTQRRLAETRRALHLISEAVTQAPASIVITDVSGSILYVNPSFCRDSGYDADEVLGRNPRMLKSGEHDAAFYADMWRTLTAGRAWRGRIVNRRKDGELIHEDVVISPVVDATGATTHYVGVKRDISEEVVREQMFRQAQKLEAVGRLAGGVAHDFNNLLTVIAGRAEMLRAELGDARTPLVRHLDQIAQAAERGAQLSRQLLTFSRSERPAVAVHDFDACVLSALHFLRPLISEDVMVEEDLGCAGALIEADEGRLHQIIMNLLVNAADAISGGGTVTVTTRRLAGRGAVELVIADSGSGMPPGLLTRIFDPFFTTKEVGRGTGLGLYTVWTIVRELRGEIEVESAVGRGTTFRIWLPSLPESSAASDDRAAAPGGDGPASEERAPRSARILVVEDDALVLGLAVGVLEEAGYDVTSAADGALADALMVDDAAFDVVVSDARMPNLGGPALLARLRDRAWSGGFVLMSGYADEDRSGPADAVALAKPFTPSALIDAVEAALTASGRDPA